MEAQATMQIALTCPQCGGEVELSEDASVFHCSFCESTLKPTGRNEVQSFYFPAKGNTDSVGKALLKALRQKKGIRASIMKSDLAYAPFWRVKGMLFQWAFGREYQSTVYDGPSFDYFKKLRAVPYIRTFPAFEADQFQMLSIGLRAQAMKMHPFNREKMGPEAVVLDQKVSLKEAVKKSLQTSAPVLDGGKRSVHIQKTALIGEKYSLLYFPVFYFVLEMGGKEQKVIIDGLSHRIIKGALPEDAISPTTPTQKLPFTPLNFIPFKCPNCGWDLPFQPSARIHLCNTCGMAWQEFGGRFHQVRYKVWEPEAPTKKVLYLPLWRLQVTINTKNRQYRTLKDFFQLFPQPRIHTGRKLDHEPIYFYVPAFRIRNPVAVDKFASRFILRQPPIPEDLPTNLRQQKAGPAWLPLGEAMEMAGILLLSITPKRSKPIQSAVKDAKIKLEHRELIWVPFAEKGIFLREVHTDLAIQKNCLELE